MQILFIISILCFLVLVWAGIGIARHIHNSHKQSESPVAPQSSFAEHLIAAVKDGSAPPPHPIPQQNVKDVTAKKSWNSTPPAMQIGPENEPDALLAAQGMRRSPQPSRYATSGHLDWEYFSKNTGNLTDLYQPKHLRANSGVGPTSSNRF